MNLRIFPPMFLLSALIISGPCHGQSGSSTKTKVATSETDFHKLPDSYWRAKLPPEVYEVTRKKGTEPAFTGKYWNNHEKGEYTCSNCGAKLFTSDTKFESGTGWPSFYKADPKAVTQIVDNSFGMSRTEVTCSACGAHLGHVFDDGPKPTGLRYCINSASLNFKKN